jgi:hypothetical protein
VIKPVDVLFGGLRCRAFEVIHATYGGLYVQVPAHHVRYFREEIGVDAIARIGELRCSMCGVLWRFTEDGRIITFPFVPMPGWVVENRTALRPPTAEPQVIDVRARCGECVGKLIEHAMEVFR